MKFTYQIIAAGILCAASAVSATGDQAGGTSSMLCALTNTVSCDNDGDGGKPVNSKYCKMQRVARPLKK